MDVGVHCAVCGRLDFLPFECHKCGQTLCGDHRQHECATVQTRAPAGGRPRQERTRQERTRQERTANGLAAPHAPIAKSRPEPLAAKPGAKPDAKPGIKSDAKPGAKPDAKRSSAAPRVGRDEAAPRGERAAAALARLKQLIGGKPSAPDRKPNAPLNRSAAAVSPSERRTAVGSTAVPQRERTYFKIERARHETTDALTRATTTRPAKEAVMFFGAAAPAGQVLDSASKHLAVPHAVLRDRTGAPVDLALPARELPTQLILVPK